MCSAYIEAVRNTPFLVQIFLLYFGLASVGVRMPTFTAAVLAMIVNIAAYAAEIIRAGLESIPRGQIEAAECLGLSKWRIGWHVMLQPSIEKVYPALTSQFLLMMQASAMASQISAEELTAIANTVQSDTFRSLETYIVVAALYLVLSLIIKFATGVLGEYVFRRKRVLRKGRGPQRQADGRHHASQRGQPRRRGLRRKHPDVRQLHAHTPALPVHGDRVDAGPFRPGFRAGRCRRLRGDAGAHLAQSLAALDRHRLHRMHPGAFRF